MKRLAHGTAKFIASVYCSDLVMVKPFDVHDVRQPGAEPDGDAEERREADHAGDDAARKHR